MGTFSQKIHCQEMPSTTAPPTSGPHGDREPADAAPGAERQAALLGRDRRAEDGQRQRRDDRAAEALHGPRDDQRLHRGRERGRHGRCREDAEPDHEDAAGGRSGRRGRRR